MLRAIDDGRADERKADADKIRAYADRVESGDIANLILVMDSREAKCFERFGIWDDRWRMLGALEYAKGGLIDD